MSDAVERVEKYWVDMTRAGLSEDKLASEIGPHPVITKPASVYLY
jgi:hypothetical protein